MADWELLNKHRMRKGQFRSDPIDGFNGLFTIPIRGKLVRIIASDGLDWQHVSVTITNSNETPSWQLMCAVKELFWNDQDWVVQFHPAKSEYVNNHPGCLHLWKPNAQILPTPDSLLAGLKPNGVSRAR